MKISKSSNLLILVMILINGITLAQPGYYYPPPSSIIYFSDTLTINPPDSLPGDPVTLLGYNIYIDEDFYGNIMISNPGEVVDYFLDDESLVPGARIFCVDAVYNEWISESACDTAFIAYGYELPFYEDWSSGNFETMQWTTDSDHWIINNDDGNPSPSLSFQGEPGLTNYEAVVESYPMNGIGMTIGTIWLDFDIKFQCINSTNNEHLLIQIWNHSSQSWTTYAEFSNGEGSFDWRWEHINIKYQSIDKVFKIRLIASGLNSLDISVWHIDNIHVYRKCDGPSETEITEFDDYNLIKWDLPDGCGIDEWIHWDDGLNSGNSIGPGIASEFMVAARWDAGQLSEYVNTVIDKVKFYPAEWAATYNIRIWSGEGADSMLVDQPVISPVIGAWNTIAIEPPITVDISKDLWVGYYINAQTGWPAGVDDGPAINGYGNMMFWEGEWQTMLEINQELNYNWNIACHIYSIWNHSEWDYNLYRKTNDEAYQFYDTAADAGIYIDSNLLITDHYCYKVTAMYMKSGDTCESNPSEQVCEQLWNGTGEHIVDNSFRVYPNPASSFLNIESPEIINEIRIYNILGECELKLEIGNLEGKVDVSGLKNGIYFVEVVTESRSFMSKVLIAR